MNIFAIDHGNESIKTPYLAFPCGISEHNTQPPMVKSWIEWDGKYYALSKTPQEYMKDKTTNINYLVYTLFALCKEEKRGNISFKEPISLAVGLPPLYMSELQGSFQKYFLVGLQKGIQFRYCGEEKNITVNSVSVYPQGYSAAYAYRPHQSVSNKIDKRNKILSEFDRYLIIDIGGVTVDIIYFDDNLPVLDKTATKPLGIIKMTEEIINKVEMEHGYEVSRRDIEAVLRKEKHILPEPLVKYIRECCADWSSKLITQVGAIVSDLRLIPCVFMGGGALLLEKDLKTDTRLPSEIEFIKDPKANAEGYLLLEKIMMKRKEKEMSKQRGN